MDGLLNDEMPQMQKYGLDPMKAYSYVSNLGTRDLLYAYLKDINVAGLGRIRRSGDCGKPGRSGGNRYTVKCNVLLDGVAVNIVSDLKYMGGPPKTIHAQVTFSSMNALLEVTYVPKRVAEINLKLSSTPVDKVTFSELKEHPYYSAIERGYSREAIRILKERLSTEYKLLLQMAASKMRFPS